MSVMPDQRITRVAIIVCVLFAPLFLSAQDTLPAVDLYGEWRRWEVNLLAPSDSTGSLIDLSDVLQEYSPANILNYGPGSISSVQYLGSNSSQNTVFWEGIPLNSPFLGGLNTQTLPLHNLESIQLTKGNDAENGVYPGTIGAGVVLKDRLNTLNTSRVEAQSSLSSLRNSSLSVSLLENVKEWTQSISFSTQRDENAFQYFSPFTQRVETREHTANQLLSLGWSAKKRAERSEVEAAFWMSQVDQEIPSTISSSSNSLNAESSEDRSRGRLLWKYDLGAGWKSKVQIAQLYSQYVYEEENILSSYVSNQRFLQARVEKVKRNTAYLVSSQWRTLRGRAAHTVSSLTDRDGFVEASVDRQLQKGEWFSSAQLFVAPNNTRYFLPRIRIRKHWLDWQIEGNIWRNVRFPTLNDRFWPETGNPNLKTEHAWSASTTMAYSPSNMLFSIEHQSRQVKNWLQWTPNAEGVFSPSNTATVEAHSLSILTGFVKEWINKKLHFRVSSTYNSVQTPDRKQLIFQPMWQVKAHCKVEGKHNGFKLQYIWSGKAYTDTRNTEFMPWWNTLDCSFWQSFAHKKVQGRIEITLRNVTNIDYQIQPNFPMPRRWIMASIFFSMV